PPIGFSEIFAELGAAADVEPGLFVVSSPLPAPQPAIASAATNPMIALLARISGALPAKLVLLFLAAGLADDVVGVDRHHVAGVVNPRLRRAVGSLDDEFTLGNAAAVGHRLGLALKTGLDPVLDCVGAGDHRGQR